MSVQSRPRPFVLPLENSSMINEVSEELVDVVKGNFLKFYDVSIQKEQVVLKDKGTYYREDKPAFPVLKLLFAGNSKPKTRKGDKSLQAVNLHAVFSPKINVVEVPVFEDMEPKWFTKKDKDDVICINSKKVDLKPIAFKVPWEDFMEISVSEMDGERMYIRESVMEVRQEKIESCIRSGVETVPLIARDERQDVVRELVKDV